MADVQLVTKELNMFDTFMSIFPDMDEQNEAHRLWYDRHGRQAVHRRKVAWKTGETFDPDVLFFRTVDTGRLLTMRNAPWRAQVWATWGQWADIEQTKKSKGAGPQQPRVFEFVLLPIMHEISLVRNFHDMNCGDVPIIYTGWSAKLLQEALQY